MRTLKLVIAYDGTAYCGWQLQPNGTTVQAVVEAAIAQILGPHRTLVAGRTDSGVHALGQVVSFRTGKTLDTVTLLRALNANLPLDVAVLSVEEVPNDFDPRRDAISKLYRYRVYDRPIRPVLTRHQVWHVFNVDWGKIEEAAPALIGRHDFASFEDSGSQSKDAIRTLSRVAVVRDPAPGEVWIEVEGDGFVKHMVRNIVGTLMEIGRGAHPVSWLPDVLDAKDRRAAGPTAPGCGLTLVEIRYGSGA